MPRLHNVLRLAALALPLVLVGCSAVSSTARRAAVVGAGTAGGAALGYALSDHDPAKTAFGAVAGGTLTHLAMGEDETVRQDGFDQGYVHGQSDAIKRQYFLRHALEAEPPQGANAGETVYYVMPGPEVTSDGRKLEPHQVAVRVVE